MEVTVRFSLPGSAGRRDPAREPRGYGAVASMITERKEAWLLGPGARSWGPAVELFQGLGQDILG